MVKESDIDEKEFVKIEAIICSMTAEERRKPKILNASRRIRIAKGSGTKVQDVNKFMNSFEQTQRIMKKMQSEKNLNKMLKGLDANALKKLR